MTALAVCRLSVGAQEYPAGEMKRLSVPTTTSVTPIHVAAREIEREGLYPAILHLKGSVEIKTPVCLKGGAGGALYCAGYVVLRADEAEFHEGSGQMEARGNVRVTREE
jgi:lipopolysaccharide assembly outer membrane protein LptD (OstA)